MDQAEVLREAANTGDVDAMTWYADFLERNGGEDEAELWYRQAAGIGDPVALPRLAHLLERNGREDEAELWYRRAAEANDPTALLRLAEFLNHHGREDEAELWYRRAADANDPTALLILAGLLERNGREDAAELWYRRAADTGNVRAMKSYTDFRYRQEPSEEDSYRPSGGGFPALATTVLVTAAAVPFLQTIMTKAGEDGYNAVRSALRKLGRQRLVVPPADDEGMTSVIILVPLDAPDDALRRLTSMDLAALRRASDARAIEITWDDARQQWNIVARE